VPAHHSRKAAIRQRMQLTGESFRQAAHTVDHERFLATVESIVCTCAGNPLACEYPDCDPASQISMCFECLYVFDATSDDPGNGRCPNGCGDRPGRG